MFGFKSEKDNIQEEKDIPILTIDHYPGKEFDAIGMVTVEALNKGSITKSIELCIAIPELKKEALKINADAVIGVRMFLISNGTVYAYGTAIKFK